jgi:hypothetical protein
VYRVMSISSKKETRNDELAAGTYNSWFSVFRPALDTNMIFRSVPFGFLPEGANVNSERVLLSPNSQGMPEQRLACKTGPSLFRAGFSFSLGYVILVGCVVFDALALREHVDSGDLAALYASFSTRVCPGQGLSGWRTSAPSKWS